MKFKALTTMLIFIVMHFVSFSQDESPVLTPKMIGQGTYHGQVGPLRDIPPMTESEMQELDKKEALKRRNLKLRYRAYPNAENALPKGDDEAWQKSMGGLKSVDAIIEHWAGQTSTSNPPDDNGTAGPNHYMQTINVKYTIYNKQGTLLAGPTNLNTLFSGVPGANNNDGDPIVLYDEQAGRWLVAEFSGVSSSPDYMLIAVSATDDPTGVWNRWSFVMNGFPDYMKFGIWQDGYYMGTNTTSGDDIYIFERDEMMNSGTSPQMVQFNNPNRPNSGFHCVLPIDNDGPFAPAGTPGGFITINDDAWGGGADALWVFQADIDWTTPSNSTFQRTQVIPVTSFDSNFGSSWENIRQPGTSQKLDAINQILMHRAQYRNFGTSQTLVCNHTVDVDNTDHAGVRWYELAWNGSAWQIRQQGTYAPDSHSRWMASIAMNGNHEIGLAYSISSSTVYPGIRYTGQSASANASATGIMDIAEETIWTGAASQTSSERWGDYANLAVDPADNATFWFTTQYNISGGTKGTRIASFALSAANPVVSDFVGSPLEVAVGGSVAFTDLSTFNPDTWDWTFEGGTPATSSQQNPTITYNTAGVYDVSLHATNVNGGNTMTKNNYITVMDNYLTLSANAANVSSSSGNKSFNVQSNISWTVSETCSWLTLAPASGTGNGTITINYQQNTDVAERQCVITVQGGAFTETFTLTQAGAAPFLNISPNAANVGSTATSVSFSITSNLDWAVTESCPWVTDAPGSGSGNGTITVNFQENTDVIERQCVITVQGGAFSETFTLTQVGAAPFLNISPNASNVGSQASLVSFSIISNINWTVTESCPWVTVAPGSGSGNGTVIVNFQENTGLTERQCLITVEGSSLTQIFTLTQGGTSPYLNIDPTSETVGPNASTTSFTISSNVDWSIAESCSWVSVNPASGSGNQTIVVTYMANTSFVGRECEIIIEGNSITKTFVLDQQGISPYLNIDPTSQTVGPYASTTTFAILSNVDWSITESCSWVSVNPASGSGDQTIVVTYMANTSIVERVCEITVEGNSITKTFTLTQQGSEPYLDVNPAAELVGPEASSTTFNIISNVSWTLSETCSWVTVSPGSGSGNQLVTVTFSENTTINQRECEITAEGNSLVATFTLTQGGASEFLDLEFYTKDVTYPAGSFNVQVASNTSWVVSESCDWLTVSPASGTGIVNLTVNYTQNLDIARSCQISVASSGIEKILTVNQDAFPIGVAELDESSISIYPNPAQKFFHVETSVNIDKIEVIDALGKIVLELEKPAKNQKIDAEKWEKGFYFIRLTKGDIVITQSIQVQ